MCRPFADGAAVGRRGRSVVRERGRDGCEGEDDQCERGEALHGRASMCRGVDDVPDCVSVA